MSAASQYLLLFYRAESDVDDMTQEERQANVAGYFVLADELRGNGTYVTGAPLQPIATATTVRVRDDEVVLTDGPFAETKEQLGGYFLIESGSLEEACAVAGKVPAARYGSVEVRPVVPAPVETRSG